MIASRFLHGPTLVSNSRLRFSQFSTSSTTVTWTSTAQQEQQPKTSTNQTQQPIDQNDLFHRVDLRVGTILGAESHPEAEHLYIEKVDVGEPEARTIVSGLAKYDKRVVVVANLKSSRFRGVLSQGMLLASSSQDQSIVDLLSVPSDCVNGERVHLSGLETLSTPDPVLKPKQKVFEQIAQHLLTDKDGVATYKSVPLMTKAGPVTSKMVKLGQIS
ncbi:hypothetical protein BCR42DRAFT_436703 [Absidia repens]|uniref:tRNA-binding domain-containing protein n=1 Tax=Absidia repens TaxID=90262 RepID=A0A1X2IK52_9FUNG|nr:hypothetical protein BCR42DRAFT_436703 [Absidia repens]